jgi:YggT family protein
MVFDTISHVQQFVDVFLTVYVLAIVLLVLTSWVRLPYALDPLQRFLHDVCDPYLRFWRRILPSFGPFDLSPMVGIFGVILLDRIVSALLSRLH